MQIKTMTPAVNLNPQADLSTNSWVVNNDFVFVLTAENFRHRNVTPARTYTVKQIRPKRLRAEMTRHALRKAKKDKQVKISYKKIDDIYYKTLLSDNVSRLYALCARVDNFIEGVLTRAFWY